ncbi:MAG: hypothetical protein OP8BY_1119 [Candidatus Saccharicenans subterraneus]|uniref:Uncharacterized protein n=1 Tax=Candidatus Saccharicenans subterraneus TaxID=2508984 RepID=A0A3E2BJT3_9BACT|nr:MAG: hypothetical protein OP8BY_1119 [Candidatus Saccharicenans subterraneum]
MINITGYSERGVINSFFYELKYFNTDEKTHLNLLGEFIWNKMYQFCLNPDHFFKETLKAIKWNNGQIDKLTK